MLKYFFEGGRSVKNIYQAAICCRGTPKTPSAFFQSGTGGVASGCPVARVTTASDAPHDPHAAFFCHQNRPLGQNEFCPPFGIGVFGETKLCTSAVY